MFSCMENSFCQSNVKTVYKLCFLTALGFLYGIPEGLPVCIFRRGMGRQKDFGTDHAAFAGVVAVFAVILAVQFFAGAVGGGCHNRLPGASFDLRYMKMEQCDIYPFPFCSVALWALTADMSKLLTSGKVSAFSAKA